MNIVKQRGTQRLSSSLYRIQHRRGQKSSSNTQVPEPWVITEARVIDCVPVRERDVTCERSLIHCPVRGNHTKLVIFTCRFEQRPQKYEFNLFTKSNVKYNERQLCNQKFVPGDDRAGCVIRTPAFEVASSAQTCTACLISRIQQ